MIQINSFNTVYELHGITVKEFSWKGVDLNLLVAFQALYETKSVSLAAQECYVSQSAMSHTLQRMRTLFDDPLFKRVGVRMEPTQRSHDIAPLVHNLLASIQNDVLSKKGFDPQSYSGVWKIGLTDYAEQLFAPILFDAIKNESPHSQISFFNVNRSNYQAIADSEHIDAIIGSIDGHSRRFTSQHLYSEQHLCLFDPLTFEHQNPMTLEQFVSVEHALVSSDGSLETQVDKKLAKMGHERRVGVASRNFLTIRKLLIGRKMVCIIPKRFAQLEMYNYSLTAVAAPLEVPDFDIKLLFLSANQYEEKSIWLRNIITRVVK